jgi:hypothetical protein
VDGDRKEDGWIESVERISCKGAKLIKQACIKDGEVDYIGRNRNVLNPEIRSGMPPPVNRESR